MPRVLLAAALVPLAFLAACASPTDGVQITPATPILARGAHLRFQVVGDDLLGAVTATSSDPRVVAIETPVVQDVASTQAAVDVHAGLPGFADVSVFVSGELLTTRHLEVRQAEAVFFRLPDDPDETVYDQITVDAAGQVELVAVPLDVDGTPLGGTGLLGVSGAAGVSIAASDPNATTDGIVIHIGAAGSADVALRLGQKRVHTLHVDAVTDAAAATLDLVGPEAAPAIGEVECVAVVARTETAERIHGARATWTHTNAILSTDPGDHVCFLHLPDAPETVLTASYGTLTAELAVHGEDFAVE
jgi:hypothetical protein